MLTSWKILALVVLSGTVGSAVAQAPDTLWTRWYGGIYDNTPEKGCSTIEGNYVLAGTTNSYGSFDYNVGALCFNSSGDTVWTSYYGAPARTDYGRAVATTPDSGLVLAGCARFTDFQTLLIKTDLRGIVKWQKTYDMPLDAYPAGVICLADTGFIVGGYADDPTNSSNTNFYAIRTKSNGDTVWMRSYGTSLEEYAHAACATPDSGMILVGHSVASGTSDRNVYAVRIKSNGDTAWTNTYGGATWDEAWSVIAMSDGSYLIGGYSIVSPGGENVLLLKIDGDGNVIWSSTIGGSNNERAYDVRETSDHGIVIGGSISIAGKMHQMLLMRANVSGAFQWSTNCGGVGTDYASFVHQNEDGTLILGGRTNTNTGGYYKFYIAKYATPATGAPQTEGILPTRFALYQNYPNPFNPTTSISFDLPERTFIRLSLYDLLGHEIACLVSSELPAGHHQIQWDAAGVASGVYLYRLQGGGWISTKKLILLR
jgi:hypothetical protein